VAVVSESETEPESDGSAFPVQPPNGNESFLAPQSRPEMIDPTPTDETKLFGDGCAPAGTYAEPHCERWPVWSSQTWGIASTQRKPLETETYREVLPAKDHQAEVCSVHQVSETIVDGQSVIRSASAENPDLCCAASASCGPKRTSHLHMRHWQAAQILT
jgi:hypothetical protein